MPRGPVRYEVVAAGDSRAAMPWLFGRGTREHVLASLAIAGPMYVYEIREAIGNQTVGHFCRDLRPLLSCGLILEKRQCGTRRYISLNELHPWYNEFRALCDALAAIGKPRVLFATSSRPRALRKVVKPLWETSSVLFGSVGRTSVLLGVLSKMRPQDIVRSMGVDPKHVSETLQRLKARGMVVEIGGRVSFNDRDAISQHLYGLLQRIRDISPFAPGALNVAKRGDGKAWECPVVFGTQSRTQLIALLALNGPSGYCELVRATGLSNATIYCDVALLERIGVVKSYASVEGRRRFFALDTTYPAYQEIQNIGRSIAVANHAPRWHATTPIEPTSCAGYAAGARRPWLFKRSLKMRTLLLVYATGGMSYGALATALGLRYLHARRAVEHLTNDGLLSLKRNGRRVQVVPNPMDPYRRELGALVATLLQVKHPEIAGLARAIPGVSKPKSLYGKT